eukprot:12902007-Prorocentrum_lima.AAC.1
MLTVLFSSVILLDEIYVKKGHLLEVNNDAILHALGSLQTKENRSLKHVGVVKTMYACDISMKHP